MKACEIGSDFWDVPTCGCSHTLFPKDTEWFISGRSALRRIIADIEVWKPVQTVALPSWCCDSMIKPFVEKGIDVVFYPVYMDNRRNLVGDFSLAAKCDAVVVMDYFGYTKSIDPPELSGIVIRDVTHSVFSKQHSDADYYYGSLRKWAGIWTGGYAWSSVGWHRQGLCSQPLERYLMLRRTAMQEKAEYIRGQRDDKAYLEKFSEAEELLDQCGICSASERDLKLSYKLDIELIRNKRRDNAKRLLETVADMAMFPQLQPSDCPLFVPILVDCRWRDALRHFFVENKVYCPIHWQVSRYHQLNSQTRLIYDQELSLVCDQRYSTEDMDRICDVFERFFEKYGD